jgi:hypothetical protein
MSTLRRHRSALILAAGATMLVAAAPKPAHQAEVERAIFELCPKLIARTLSLDDPATLAQIGYTATAPRKVEGGANPRAVRGAGTGQVVLSAGRDSDGGGSCAVWFGGADAPEVFKLFKKLQARAKKEGFKGGNMLKLGDETPLFPYNRGGDAPLSLIFFAADAGGEFETSPAMTAVMMTKKGD